MPEFDEHIRFYGAGPCTIAGRDFKRARLHVYAVDGIELTCDVGDDGRCDAHASATECRRAYKSSTSVKKLFTKAGTDFDADKITRNMMLRGKMRTNARYNEKVVSEMIELYACFPPEPTGDAFADAAAARVVDVASFHREWDVLAERASAGSPAQTWLERYISTCAGILKRLWHEASVAGTAMHADIECFWNAVIVGLGDEWRAYLESLERAEFTQFFDWYDSWFVPRGLRPYRVELLVFDRAMGIVGAIDFLAEHEETGKKFIIDWKRAISLDSAEFFRSLVVDGGGGDSPYEWCQRRPRYGESLFLPPFDTYVCNKLTGYTMQQCIYRLVLERNTSFTIDDVVLVVLHPEHARYDVVRITVPDDFNAKLVAYMTARRAC